MRPIRKIGRALTVRYRIHDQEYEINEDYEYDYDVEKISATVILELTNHYLISDPCSYPN